MDLRSELPASLGDEDERDALARQVAEDWRAAGLGPLDAALCAYAEKLTRTPSAMTAADLEGLRVLGLDDYSLHDAVQVVSYFNYINRIADALHVELEDFMPAYPDGTR